MKTGIWKTWMPLFGLLLAGFVGGGILTACSDDDGALAEQEYAVMAPPDTEGYLLTAPERAVPGETVTVTVRVTDGKSRIASVAANGVQCDRISGDETQGTFGFEMPARDVELSVVLTGPEAWAITWTESQFYTVEVAESAVRGTPVDVRVTVVSGMFKISSVTWNDTPCELLSEEDPTWHFRFTMPDEAVTLDIVADIDRHRITPVQGEHAILTMLNCCHNWDAAPEERIFEEAMHGIVKFLWGAELGYDATLKVTAEDGTEVPCKYTDEDLDFGKCWYCVMPDAPITLSVYATERTDYAGKPFVGVYRGYPLLVGEQRIFRSTQPSFSLSLNANTSFLAVSDAPEAFRFDGCYTFDEAKNSFAYREEYSDDGYGRKDFGVSGTWFGGGELFAWVSDLLHDSPDRMKFYFAATSDCEYICAASDAYGTRYLLELTRDGTKSWYLAETRELRMRPATVAFDRGTSIGETSCAIVSCDGTPLYRYELAAPDAVPLFTARGREAGTYALQGGSVSDPVLTLDGFGSATVGEVCGSYTCDNGLVTVTFGDGTTATYSLDPGAGTYSKIGSAVWEGPLNYMTMVYDAVYDGTTTMGTVLLTLDSDFSGHECPGRAKFVVRLVDPYYTDWTAIACEVSYAYDPAAGELLLSQVLVGTADGLSTELVNVRFDVSEDASALTCPDEGRLRATSGGDTRYVNLRGLRLVAR